VIVEEILFWDLVYFVVYLPVSFVLNAITGKGDVFGIMPFLCFVAPLLLHARKNQRPRRALN